MSATIAITGASGFLGRHLLQHFLAEGRDVVALTRRPAALDDVSHPRLRVIETDYSLSMAEHLDRGGSLIHLAAQRNAPAKTPAVFTHANVVLAETVVRAAVARGSRLVHVSTAFVLGPSDQPREAGAPLDQETQDAYVRSRVAGLLAVERAAGGWIPCVTLLPSIIFGPDHPRAHNRITTHMRRTLRGPLRVAIGNTPARRNLVYVADVIRAVARAEAQGDASGRHLVSGENVTQDQLEHAVRESQGLRPGRRVVVPRAAALAASRVADAVLGYHITCGWTRRMLTLLAPWCVAPYATFGGANANPTPFAVAVRETVAALSAEHKGAVSQ